MGSRNTARHADYTWNDYRSWSDGQRWQVIGGDAYVMTPAPATRHQDVLVALAAQMQNHFGGHPCRVYVAPTDLKLSETDIVQPDLMVVCESEKIKSSHIEGPPTLVVEILSPATALLDRTRKMRLYAAAGVCEVWLITPYPWLVEVFVLDGATYRLSGSFTKGDKMASPAFPTLRIDLDRMFDFPLESGEETMMVRESHPPYGKNPS